MKTRELFEATSKSPVCIHGQFIILDMEQRDHPVVAAARAALAETRKAEKAVSNG